MEWSTVKKSKIILLVCICLAAALAVVLIVTLRSGSSFEPSKWLVPGDDAVAEMDFETELNSISVMDNTWETALPQTVIHDLIQAHFDAPLPEGKTEKKAIVIGYDGCRTDTFRLLETSKRSAINTLLQNGGHAIFTYAGGANYPQELLQKTSTAPGWCSMLTGVLSDVHGVTGNKTPKGLEPKTLLLSLVESGAADSSAMYVSWKKHFSTKKATYRAEKDYAEANGIPAVYLRAEDDAGTRQNILDDLAKQDCTDFIFSTHEYTDHAGHGSGFSLQNIKYVSGFRDAEATGADIIEAIESRPTYADEDWLILITSDHGGIKKNHGGPSFEERITFIVSNKEIPLESGSVN